VQATDLAVLPYKEHPGFQGSGAVTDYLARGVPVVATDVANMRELVGEAGVIVPPGDPAALASALAVLRYIALTCGYRNRPSCLP
jgi:glycosyltransferase involved in cell wall biosynthesis